MSNRERAADLITTWQARHKTEMDNNTDWAAQNLAGDLADAGMLAPDTAVEFDENGIWQECGEEPELFVLSKGLPVGFAAIGVFDRDENRFNVLARPAEEMREFAHAILAAANYSEVEQ